MSAVWQLLERGGWIMPVIVGLSVLLYSRCFRLLFSLWAQRRRLQSAASHAVLSRLQLELRESFRRQRAAIGPMIAAAPLLGLLGTVSGMEKAFGSLSASAGQKSMESGLTVAIPAMLLLYLAHREMHRQVEAANRFERRLGRAGGAS